MSEAEKNFPATELVALRNWLDRSPGGISIVVTNNPDDFHKTLEQIGTDFKEHELYVGLEKIPTREIKKKFEGLSRREVLVVRGVHVDKKDIGLPIGEFCTEYARYLSGNLNMGGCRLVGEARQQQVKILIPVKPEMDAWLLRHAGDFRDRMHTIDLEMGE